MKKYIKIGLTCLTGILLATSCDVMDTQPKESYDDNLVWGSKETADAFVYSTYAEILKQYTDGEGKDRNSFTLIESFTPNSVHCNLGSLDGFPTETGLDRYSDYGRIFDKDKGFGLMRRCNMIMEKAQSSDFTDEQKKELVAEGRFLRGYVFFMQARWTGRIVPITKVLDENSTEEFMTPLTKDPAETYKYIIDDFKAAADGLPETSLSGRANKYAAYAYLSRAALQAYAYTKDNSYLTLCEEASKAVINSGKYPLSSNYGNMFLESGAYDKEIIFAFYRLDQNTTTTTFENELVGCQPNIGADEVTASMSSPALKNTNGKTFEGWATYFPTQDLVDQYLVIDVADGKAKSLYETSQYSSNVIEKAVTDLQEGDLQAKRGDNETQGSKWSVPEKEDLGSNAKGQKILRYGIVQTSEKINEIMYNNRDARFYSTIVYDSCTWQNELVTLCCRGNLWAGNRDGQSDSWYTTASGYYWRKGVYDVAPRLYAGNKTNYHLVMARSGEMYLNLAEVYLLKKDIPNAVKMLNETRVQHGQLPASTAATEEEAWKDYIRERRVEMAKENDLYWSYLRWGKYGGYANEGEAEGGVIKALNRPVHKIQISKDRKKFFIGQIVRANAWNRNFSVRRYLMPIPQGGLDKRAASGLVEVNNPGW